jgi:hypothetical protein
VDLCKRLNEFRFVFALYNLPFLHFLLDQKVKQKIKSHRSHSGEISLFLASALTSVAVWATAPPFGFRFLLCIGLSDILL